MTSWIPDPETEPDKFINDFVMHASSKCDFIGVDIEPDLISDMIAEKIRYHFRAGYCWHFANILRSVFNRGKICWTAPFSHFVWLDDDGIAYDIEGRYEGEAYQLIPAEYLGNIVECFKHITPEHDKDTAPYDKEILIQIMKKYCKDENIVYDPDIERYYFSDTSKDVTEND